jgi:hypothetical protein
MKVHRLLAGVAFGFAAILAVPATAAVHIVELAQPLGAVTASIPELPATGDGVIIFGSVQEGLPAARMLVQ